MTLARNVEFNPEAPCYTHVGWDLMYSIKQIAMVNKRLLFTWMAAILSL